MVVREPPREQNGLTAMLIIIWIPSPKYGSMSGASHQRAFKSSCLTIGYIY